MFARLLLERAVRAFIAGAAAALSVGATSASFSVPGLKALLIGAGAAGVSAVMSLLSQAIGDPTSTSFLPGAPGSSR